MKIALVTEALGNYVSGGLNYIVNVLNCLVKQGHDVCLFLVHPPYTSEWLEASFPIYPTNSVLFEEYDGVLCAEFSPVAKLVKEHKSCKDKLYHAHTNEGLFAYNGPEWQKQAIDSYSLPLKIFCTSHYVRILMEQVYKRKCIGQLVPPGVDFDIFNTEGRSIRNYTVPPIRGFRTVTNVGIFNRGDHIRGNDVAFNALRYVADHGIKLNVVIIPDGIRDRKLLAQYYKQIDLFLDCSRLAGSPTPPKEAMACGAVCVSTPYGATDFILNGMNGFIVPVNDYAATGEAIIKYVEMPNHSKAEMHRLALETMKPYSWESITSMFLLAIKEAEARVELLEIQQ